MKNKKTNPNKYGNKSIQVKEETHDRLVEICNETGLKIHSLADQIIRKDLDKIEESHQILELIKQ